jgi:hypothetical protein
VLVDTGSLDHVAKQLSDRRKQVVDSAFSVTSSSTLSLTGGDYGGDSGPEAAAAAAAVREQLSAKIVATQLTPLHLPLERSHPTCMPLQAADVAELLAAGADPQARESASRPLLRGLRGRCRCSRSGSGTVGAT